MPAGRNAKITFAKATLVGQGKGRKVDLLRKITFFRKSAVDCSAVSAVSPWLLFLFLRRSTSQFPNPQILKFSNSYKSSIVILYNVLSTFMDLQVPFS
jgi:hypothetical protein